MPTLDATSALRVVTIILLPVAPALKGLNSLDLCRCSTASICCAFHAKAASTSSAPAAPTAADKYLMARSFWTGYRVNQTFVSFSFSHQRSCLVVVVVVVDRQRQLQI